MADDDIAVTIEPDDTATGGDAAVAEVDSQFKEMQAKLARSEEEKSAALRREATRAAEAEAARQEIVRARKEVVESRSDSVKTGITAANEAITSAKNDIKIAIEAGDASAQAEAYDKLSTARARLERLNEASADIEINKTTAARPVSQTQRPTATSDPVETFLSERSAPTATWLRNHPEYARALATGSDPRKQAKINAAHSDAVAEGIDLDSEAYFEHVETFLGLRETVAPNGHATNGAAKPVPAMRSKRPPVAPVSSTSNAIGTDTATVRLSRKQADAATDGTLVWNYDDPSGKKRFKKGDPIGHQEMARRVKAQTEQGLFRPENTEL